MFDWTLHIIDAYGYVGIFALMVLENIFPPIPSEVIIPVAGYAAAQGTLSLTLVVLVATLGATAGAFFWFWIGRVFGLSRVTRLAATHGRLLTLSPDDVAYASSWFNRHGKKAVLVGRLLPTIRTLISIPAGIARMRTMPFLLFTFVGSLLWTSLLVFFGYILKQQAHQVADWLNPISNTIVVLIVAVYLYRVVTHKGVQRTPAPHPHD